MTEAEVSSLPAVRAEVAEKTATAVGSAAESGLGAVGRWL